MNASFHAPASSLAKLELRHPGSHPGETVNQRNSEDARSQAAVLRSAAVR